MNKKFIRIVVLVAIGLIMAGCGEQVCKTTFGNVPVGQTINVNNEQMVCTREPGKVLGIGDWYELSSTDQAAAPEAPAPAKYEPIATDYQECQDQGKLLVMNSDHTEFWCEAPAAPAPAPAAPEAPAPAPVNTRASLNYDESNGDPLTSGQTALIATYLRISAPITQQQLESAVGKIQQEGAGAKAEVHEGQTLTLDDRWAWFVWCSNAANVHVPTDVSDTLAKLYDASTMGHVWVQNNLDPKVPARSDNTWSGCDNFWAVAVH